MRVKRSALAAILALLVACGSTSRRAAAHEAAVSRLELTASPAGVAGVVKAHNLDLAAALCGNADEARWHRDWFTRHPELLEGMLAERLALVADGEFLDPSFVGAEVVAGSIRHAETWCRFSAPWNGMPEHLRVSFRLLPENPVHVTHVTIRDGADSTTASLTPLEPVITWSPATPAPAKGPDPLGTFFIEGVLHFALGPDHVAFLVGLLVLGGSLARLTLVVTSFTLAHSITLALAGTGLVRPSPLAVELLIAVSIVVVGVECLRARSDRRDHRALLAFGFGLVHGFGFANVFSASGLAGGDLVRALLAFNVGVEAGQLAFVLIGAPWLLGLDRHGPRAALVVRRLAGLAICGLGAVWVVERALMTAPR